MRTISPSEWYQLYHTTTTRSQFTKQTLKQGYFTTEQEAEIAWYSIDEVYGRNDVRPQEEP